MNSYPVKMDPSNTQVWNCENAFDFVCPRKWESLGQTEAPDVRFCGVCNQNVYLCENPLEFVTQGNLGRCVAIPREITAAQSHHPATMGRVSKSFVDQWEQRSERAKEWWTSVLGSDPKFNNEEINEIGRNLNLK